MCELYKNNKKIGHISTLQTKSLETFLKIDTFEIIYSNIHNIVFYLDLIIIF